jgi:hypothetical protein
MRNYYTDKNLGGGDLTKDISLPVVDNTKTPLKDLIDNTVTTHGFYVIKKIKLYEDNKFEFYDLWLLSTDSDPAVISDL